MKIRSRQEAQEIVLNKARADSGFRQQLVDDPKGAISRELGIALPAGLKIKVVEETDDSLFLVLPPRGAAPGELADQELDAVAGGALAAAGKAGRLSNSPVEGSLNFVPSAKPGGITGGT